MVERYKNRRGECTLTARFKLGKRALGKACGYYYWSMQSNHPVKRHTIFYAGTVSVGLVVHHLGVCAWRDEIFLSRHGEIWKLRGVMLPDKNKAVNPVKMKETAAKVWADGIARMVADLLTPKLELSLMSDAARRYHTLVYSLVNERCIKAASYGRCRTPRDFALGINRDWCQNDLLKPREPNLKHALMTSLVLALAANKAAELIRLGGWLEYRIPMFSTESALAMYHNACWQLSRLCPTWHAESYLCDYSVLGSLEELFNKQFNRVMGVANARELPVSDVAGVSPSYGADEPEWRTDVNELASFSVEVEEMARLRTEEE